MRILQYSAYFSQKFTLDLIFFFGDHFGDRLHWALTNNVKPNPKSICPLTCQKLVGDMGIYERLHRASLFGKAPDPFQNFPNRCTRAKQSKQFRFQTTLFPNIEKRHNVSEIFSSYKFTPNPLYFSHNNIHRQAQYSLSFSLSLSLSIETYTQLNFSYTTLHSSHPHGHQPISQCSGSHCQEGYLSPYDRYKNRPRRVHEGHGILDVARGPRF